MRPPSGARDAEPGADALASAFADDDFDIPAPRLRAVGRTEDLSTEELVAHWPALYRQAVRLMRHRSDAEDLAQDTFERAVRALPSFQAGTNMRAWLYTIMIRKARDHYRRENRRGHSPEELDEERLPAPEAEEKPGGWAAITQEQFSTAFSRLKSPFREVFELHEMQHLPYQDIAARLDIPMNTVASRLRRAREKLKKLLSVHLDKDDE